MPKKKEDPMEPLCRLRLLIGEKKTKEFIRKTIHEAMTEVFGEPKKPPRRKGKTSGRKGTSRRKK